MNCYSNIYGIYCNRLHIRLLKSENVHRTKLTASHRQKEPLTLLVHNIKYMIIHPYLAHFKCKKCFHHVDNCT
jgi:hypothetical protein